MKIISLQAENVKKLRAVEITPQGDVVVIAGRNGTGKTSVLDAIYMALTGDLPPKPIREGEDRAEIRLDIGTYVVKRTIIRQADGEFTTYLKIETPDSAVLKSPQKVLDSDAHRTALFENRTEVNREVRHLEGQAQMFQPANFADVPESPVRVDELMKKYRHLGNLIEAELASRKTADILRDKILSLKSQLAEAESAMEAIKIIPDVELQSLTASRLEVESQIDGADRANQKIRLRDEYRKVREHLAEKSLESEKFTAEIKSLDQAKEQAVRDAKMPIDGLGFDDSGVTYRGLPFTQLSSSEQLKISLAMAMAMNPTLRVIRITDGSLLDSENMRIIQEMARDQDYQIWIERVDETGAVGIIIEEGEVKNVQR